MKSITIADSLLRNSRKTMYGHYARIGWLPILVVL